MKKIILSALFLSFSLYLHAQQVMPDSFPPGKNGLHQLATYLLASEWEERIRLTYELLPKKEEYQAVFQEDKIKQIQKYHRKWYRKVSPAIGPRKDEQTYILIRQIKTNELQKHSEQAKSWPGGYLEIANWFVSDLEIYQITYVEPGQRVGTTFDIFVYLNGKWRVFPKPYRALKS